MTLAAPHIAKRADPDWIRSPVGYIRGFTHVADEPTRLSEIQEALVGDVTSVLRCIKKGRRTGFSFAVATQALALSQMRKGHVCIFTSHNLDDAMRKIRYARGLYESLSETERRKNPSLTDNKTSMEFANGSMLLSQFMPRGEGGWIVLDEFAHMKQDEDIYTAALPVISRGGHLITGSSVLGQSGRFWEIETGAGGKYSGYKRTEWPWWLCPELCTNVLKAERDAPDMTTEERVDRYGTEQLKIIFDGMPLEDFQQEYECAYQDESTAFYVWELIKRCEMDPEEAERWRCHSIEELVENQKGDLYAGFDVGRTRNTSELKVFDLVGSRAYERYSETMEKTPFPEQQDRLDTFLTTTRGRLTRFRIDSRGMGGPIFEALQRTHGSVVEGVEGTAPLKETICTDVRMMMERGDVKLYPDRATLGQIHSVKRKLTAAKNYIFDTDRNEKHHADKAWACFYALSGIPESHRSPAPATSVLSREMDDPGRAPGERVAAIRDDDADIQAMARRLKAKDPRLDADLALLLARKHVRRVRE